MHVQIPKGYMLLRLCRWCGGRHMDQMCTTTSMRSTPSPPPRWTMKTPPRSPPTSLNSKGEVKSKATTTFDGLCHGCGRKGHRQADCLGGFCYRRGRKGHAKADYSVHVQ
eukprot:988107-Heterocapsa_arctica.AAC.1